MVLWSLRSQAFLPHLGLPCGTLPLDANKSTIHKDVTDFTNRDNNKSNLIHSHVPFGPGGPISPLRPLTPCGPALRAGRPGSPCWPLSPLSPPKPSGPIKTKADGDKRHFQKLFLLL